MAKIPDLSKYFVDNDVGQLTEVVMDSFGIPRFETNDKRTTDKDQRTQSQQRAVVLNSAGARDRRKRWIQSRRGQTAARIDDDGEAVAEDLISHRKRSRAPNRPKDVIEAEKALKRQRKAVRESRNQTRRSSTSTSTSLELNSTSLHAEPLLS
jgi:hypothetical protein